MTGPQDELPTTVIPQQTVEQPAVTTAPATRRSRIWQRRLPARIGRARTSTVIIGCLFVLLGGLNFVLPEEDPLREVTLPNGAVVQVRESQYTPAPTTPSTTAPAETTDAPASEPSTTATTTTSRPRTTAPGQDEEQPETTTPSQTTSRTTTAPAPSSTRATTSRAPSTTAAPGEEETPVETAEPTG